MKQHEEVIKIMEENGGWATLGFLYHHVDTSEWKTKTPFATIRRIVQDERFFFKIKAGLWALKSHKEQLLEKFELEVSAKKEQDFPIPISKDYWLKLETSRDTTHISHRRIRINYSLIEN